MKFVFLASLLLSFVVTACTVNQRDPQTPAPDIRRVNTNFFFEYNEDRSVYTSRRFLFGMMSEDKVGVYRDLNFDHYNQYGTSNIEFEFNEEGDRLIGRLVNPTYPNDRNKWQILLSFRVLRTYYEENRVDGSGRTSDDRIERTDRSDPRARTFMDLDLASMDFENEVFATWGSAFRRRVIQKIEDVEWSEDDKFLGFTAVSSNAALGSNAQTVDRVNFLRMDETPSDFEITPYNKFNDQHIQILHIAGSRPNHFGEDLKAIHWDINERSKKTHKIYLHNFPEEYVQIGVDSVESWNDVFEGLVGYRPFTTEVLESKYAFDLRKHVIHWVDDIRLSAAGPLGVANVAADVETGRVLWTGSIIWGGLLDRYAGRHVPSSSVVGMDAFADRAHRLDGLISGPQANWSQPLVRPGAGASSNFYDNFTSFLSRSVQTQNQQVIEERIAEFNAGVERALERNEISSEEAEQRRTTFALEARQPEDLFSADQLLHTLNEAMAMERVHDVDLDEGFRHLQQHPLSFEQILDEVGLSNEGADHPLFLGILDRESEFFQNLPSALQERAMPTPDGFYEHSHDTDHSALEAILSLNSGIAERLGAGEIVDIEQVKRGMIRNTLVHEIGHTLGLGHNFKSNILPQKGHVPNAIYNELEREAKAVWTDANGQPAEKMTNTSSIMGYPDGLTEALKDYDDHKPGWNDLERLRYLYKRQYPMYDKTSNGESDYVWVDLQNDGRILPQITRDGKTLTPGYLPNCNDLEASFYMDPYCARHDRGYNAQTLMKSYFDRFWDRIHQSLESNIDALSTRNYRRVEGIMWWIASKTLSRGRLFHDYMRNRYRSEIQELNAGGMETYQNILDFSQSCRDLSGVDSNELSQRREDPKYARFIEQQVDGTYQVNQFGDLCIATTYYFDQLNELLQLEGKEYTEIDYFNTLAPGGLRSGENTQDYSQMWGSWKRISLLPIKFKIMQNMILPFSTMTLGGRDYRIYIYGRPDTSFSMSTLFPKEYLRVLRSYVESTISINDPTREPSISASLYYLGYFLRFQTQTRDYGIFPSEILDSVSSLTQFRFSPAMIQIDATKEDGSQYAKSFRGSIYNRYNNSGRETLGNVYLYTFDRIVMSAQNNSLALQATPVRWRTPSAGVALAIKLDYAPNYNFEELEAYSPRKYFIDNYINSLEQCVKGDNAAGDNGLESYFNANNENFEGILIPFNIDTRSSAYREVNDSIIFNLEQFSQARNFDLRSCESALKNQTVLVLGAAMMMGYIFPETLRYYEMGVN